MPTLVLGVLDVAYSQQNEDGTPAKPTTTGDVAEILEDRYHVMETFYDLRKGQIAQFLADSMARALQDLFNGRPPLHDMADAEQQIERSFRSFLDANEMQKLAIAVSGEPLSGAAMRGVNHRKKHPYAQKNRARPAFIDTGLYRSSFRCTVRR